ncbi:Subtilase family protein [Singulisphaera sp. GP187]|uniref:S8 family serine peptidase n=1 Tax=Singulisphaera sp. GP187 TaxID=1882752 RepID=UPI000927BA09|nr:S8 family serine peptidase [Singulisphaera sp. GP187]SIO43362.1 Subtilase family protein [Singulisphaera sp. GP187]
MRWRAIACLLLLVAFDRPGRGQSVGLDSELSSPGHRPPVARMADVPAVRKRLGLTAVYDGIAGIDSVKVAVLDYGFAGLGQGRPYLPASAEVVEHYDPAFVQRNGLGDPDFRTPFDPSNRHGRVMAQILWSVTGSNPKGPKFYLLNASGPTMLRRAVRFAIEHQVDLILFSGSFEGGGNGDGRGPINRVIAEATAAGIPWINAAGNSGRKVFNGPVRILKDGFLRLRDGSDVASLRFRNRVDENKVSVTLTWSDYREEEDAGTDKDLDLYVEDPSGRPVGAGEKRQVPGSRVPGPDETRNPRERVVLDALPASPEVLTDPDYCYRIRIRAKRGRFLATDRLRVLVTASRESYLPPGGDSPREALVFLDASGEEELYPPADNPLVLTVGDTDMSSSIGPTTDRRVKPDVILADSRAFFTDGEVSAGSSNAAAYVAGVVAVLKAAAPGLRPSHLLRIAQQGPIVPYSALVGRPTRPANSPPPGFHYWQTPTRAKLAELVREKR